MKDKTEYTYDADGDLETVTDPEGNKTTYTYNADDEPTKTEEPNKTVTETEYNSEGQVVAQIDGNKHTTKYERNALGEVTEEINPLSQKTNKEYDAAGNLVKLNGRRGPHDDLQVRPGEPSRGSQLTQTAKRRPSNTNTTLTGTVRRWLMAPAKP